MKNKKFVTAINCMDGRVQDVVNDYMKKTYNADYVDVITEPGPNRILAMNTQDHIVKNIKARVDISVTHHKSSVICIAGHDDCAGNPVDKENQIKHIKLALKVINDWNYSVKIIGLWINDNWQIEQLIKLD